MNYNFFLVFLFVYFNLFQIRVLIFVVAQELQLKVQATINHHQNFELHLKCNEVRIMSVGQIAFGLEEITYNCWLMKSINFGKIC